ncbi:MAG: radical SAM family heme chaperone HemW [Clostridia bacterium]|nr:radical SAM family heme chaperone HemW [Clostridia bacterium]
MKDLGLYIHIPFCVKKCNYCDFYSLGCVADEGIERYIDCLCLHIGMEGKNYSNRRVDSVFFGGGTPSILSVEQIKKILNAIRHSFHLTEDCEITIEANPGTLTEEKAESYKSLGINRVSIGLQSASDSELRMLGRIHTFEDFQESYRLLSLAGIDNISVDIMYALPNQKTDDFIKTVDKVCEFSPEHISAYCLKIEENTYFYKIKDTLSLPDEDEQYKMYISLCDRLEKMGYEQYEISNFAKSGKRSKHNMKYWLSLDYLGFGPASHSCIEGGRYSYSESIEEYEKSLEDGNEPKKIPEADTPLTRDEIIDEFVMLRLRLSDGVNVKEFEERFEISFENRYKKISMYEKSGYICKKNGAYAFTPKGFFVSNYILSDILESI